MSEVTILCLVGRSGVGKTTVMVQWLQFLREAGYRVASFKHSHHSLDLQDGQKDSHRLARGTQLAEGLWSGWAGSDGMQLQGDIPWWQLLKCLAQLTQPDLVLVEGGKSSPFPKIEVIREGFEPWPNLEGRIATLGQALAWEQPALWTQFLIDQKLLRGVQIVQDEG